MNINFSPKKLTRLAGLAAVAYFTSLAVSPKANALSPLLWSDSDYFINQATELNGNPALTVDKLDASFYGVTVDTVIVRINATLASSGTVTNTASSPQTFPVFALIQQFDWTPGSGAPAALSTLQPFTPFQTISTQTYTDLAPNTPTPFSLASINGSADQTFTSATDINQFLGTGSFSVDPFTTILSSFAGGGGNVNLDISTFANATLTVEYYGTGTPIPFEFSSNFGIPAFVGVLFGLSMWKRQRKLKSLTIK
ncbi:MAG: choice-of-anchor E domain-containing protein [Nostocaceae cyanobacterium]|nr:choice-of-anchor E domain-containing protein [Nostocaceae cyanobacterium]